jgi:short-subunit dehydrogenase
MAVNFFGAMQCIHAALDVLITQRGLIVVVSSLAGFAPLIALTGYAASKHALYGFFDSLRTEVDPHCVKVLLVCPSFIETGIDKNGMAGDGNLASHPQSVVGTRESRRAR